MTPVAASVASLDHVCLSAQVPGQRLQYDLLLDSEVCVLSNSVCTRVYAPLKLLKLKWFLSYDVSCAVCEARAIVHDGVFDSRFGDVHCFAPSCVEMLNALRKMH